MKKGMMHGDYDMDDRNMGGRKGKRGGPNTYGGKGGAVGTARQPSSRGGYKRGGAGRTGSSRDCGR